MFNIDFTDAFLSLLPDGALWDPSENDYTYEILVAAAQFSGTLIDGGVSGGSDFEDLSPKAGDSITVSGSVSNDGTYTVSQDWDSSNPFYIYTEETLVNELAPGTTSFRRHLKAGDLKRMLIGAADNHQIMRDFLRTLAFLRDPQNTPILSDLEKEYGVRTDTGLTEQERRDKLDAIVYAPASSGAADYLQDQLHAAGFTNLYVYRNDKSNDPGMFYGGPGGEMITNNKEYDRTITEARKYQKLWPHVFFIGGQAFYDANGRIIHIDPVPISDALKPTFREIVLQVRPVHSWCVAIVNDTAFFTFAEADTATTDTSKGFASEDGTTGGFWWEGDEDGYYGWVFALIEDDTDSTIIDDDTDDLVIDG